MSIKIIVKKQI